MELFLLLHRPPPGGLVPRKRLEERLRSFEAGEWESLVFQSIPGAEQAAHVSARRRRRERIVWMGELSAREGAEVAPGTRRTLDRLRDPVDARLNLVSFDDLFLHNLRTSRRGAGPLVMTTCSHCWIARAARLMAPLREMTQGHKDASIPENDDPKTSACRRSRRDLPDMSRNLLPECEKPFQQDILIVISFDVRSSCGDTVSTRDHDNNHLTCQLANVTDHVALERCVVESADSGTSEKQCFRGCCVSGWNSTSANGRVWHQQ